MESNRIDILYNHGVRLSRDGKYSEALCCYMKVLSIDPCHVMTFVNLSALLTRLGRYQQALMTCDKALVGDPSNIKALKNKMEIFIIIHRYDDAETVCKKILSLDPFENDALEVQEYIMYKKIRMAKKPRIEPEILPH